MSLRKRISGVRRRLSERPSKERKSAAETADAPARKRSSRPKHRSEGPHEPKRDRGAAADPKRGRSGAPDPKRGGGRSADAKRRSDKPGERRDTSGDARRLAGAAAVTARTKVLEPAGKLLAAFVRTWLAVAERLGAVVLAAWRSCLRPLLAILVALTVAMYRWLERHLSPAHGVIAVSLVALVALVASQWLDYRSITIGTEAYSGEVEVVAAAPELDRARAGDAHAWVMVALAVAGAVALALALTRRRRAARALIGIGVAVIAISVLIDAPKGLDEGAVGVAYDGAAASLIEGFWLQVASAVVLIAAGALLPRYLQPEPRPAPVKARRRGLARWLAARADRARKRDSGAAKRPARDAKPRVGEAGR